MGIGGRWEKGGGVGPAPAAQAQADGLRALNHACAARQAYGNDILLHLNVANFLPSIPLQLLTLRWHDQPGADARRGSERWLWARLLLGELEWF